MGRSTLNVLSASPSRISIKAMRPPAIRCSRDRIVRDRPARRGGSGKALEARSDRDRDHVRLQPFVVANAESDQHINEAVLSDDLHPNVGIGGQEARQDGGQHEAGGAHRHIEAERTGGPVAKAAHHIECGFHLAKREGRRSISRSSETAASPAPGEDS